MKRQFLGRLLSLFLVGTVVAGVGCKDYDDDITSLNNRIDELTTGQIASVEKQMQSLQNAVDRLDGVDSGLKDEIEALQGKAETQAGEIGKLQEELGKAASASEVEALKKQIETLESDKGKLEKRIEALESARTSLQDEIDAVKGSLANYLTKSDAEATYATKTTVESLSQLLNQIKANYVSAEGLASTLEGYVTDAELADYPTLTVLQEAIRQSETAMKNSLGEAMKPILAKYNFVQKDVLDLEIQDLQEQIDALSGKPDADGSLANIKSRLEALENAEIKYDESNAAFTKGVEDCIGKALANDGAIDQAIANAIKDVAGEYEGTMPGSEKPHRRPAHGRGSAPEPYPESRLCSGLRRSQGVGQRALLCPRGRGARSAGERYGGDDLPRYARRGCRTARGRLCRRARDVLAGNGTGEDARYGACAEYSEGRGRRDGQRPLHRDGASRRFHPRLLHG